MTICKLYAPILKLFLVRFYRWFLLWLACADLLNCLITMPTEIYILSSYYYFSSHEYCIVSRFFTYLINNSTAVVFVSISIDRYIRICRPHRSPMSIFGAKCACLLSLVIGASVSWPTYFLYGKKEVPIPLKHKDGQKVYVWGQICSILNSMDKTPYPFAYFIYLCCGVCGCFLILTILYILIGRVILKRGRTKHKRRQETMSEPTALQRNDNEKEEALLSPANVKGEQQEQQQQQQPVQQQSQDEQKPQHTSFAATVGNEVSSDNQSGEARCLNLGLNGNGCPHLTPKRWGSKMIRPPKSTLMLFAITVVFVISFLPFLIVIIIRQHVGPSFHSKLSPAMEAAVNIFLRSYLVNNCTNTIVYGLCNTQFSNEVRKILHLRNLRRSHSLSRNESRGS